MLLMIVGVCFFLMIPLPPKSTLFPYTTLYRSPGRRRPGRGRRRARARHRRGDDRRQAAQALRAARPGRAAQLLGDVDRKSTRLNSSHANISYAVFCLKKKLFITPLIS